MSNETWVWNQFKLAWPWPCDRIDPSGDHNSGIPDVSLLDAQGNRGLVELKRPDKVVLRESQWLWHEKDRLGGGLSCVVTKSHKMWMVYRINVPDRTLLSYIDTTKDIEMVITVCSLCRLSRHRV
jgi:hypothetical protein